MTANYFTALNAVDCTEHIERKGGFSYLSWPFAVKELLSRHPDATWEVVEYNGQPYCTTPAGCFVKVAVTVGGITRSQVHPVLNNNNQTVKEPNAFQINTSIQRALVKAIALHGLGLYIYAGEDIPSATQEPIWPDPAQRKHYATELLRLHKANDGPGFRQLWDELDNEQKADIWGDFGSAERKAMKTMLEATKEAA